MLIFFSFNVMNAQNTTNGETVKVDSTYFGLIGVLDEVQIVGYGMKGMKEDDYLRLRNRVYHVWPYAVIGAGYLEELNMLKAEMTKKQFRQTVSLRQKELYDNFESILKKFSRNEGRVLIKLVYRQTGISAYDIAKDLKGGFKAFWWNTAASMFSLSLKAIYAPGNNIEDYNIELILHDFFNKGILMYSPSYQEVQSPFYHEKQQPTTSKEVREEKRENQKREKQIRRQEKLDQKNYINKK
ncbi:MAG: DUF4294 domain-containing protein [Flavobacteriales bacterium]|nr:DUF4294 domain-containing protein [Flavobacteriales bacterium]